LQKCYHVAGYRSEFAEPKKKKKKVFTENKKEKQIKNNA
jgi:hypothetical protein